MGLRLNGLSADHAHRTVGIDRLSRTLFIPSEILADSPFPLPDCDQPIGRALRISPLQFSLRLLRTVPFRVRGNGTPHVIWKKRLYQLGLLHSRDSSYRPILAHGCGGFDYELGRFLSEETVEKGLFAVPKRDPPNPRHDPRLAFFGLDRLGSLREGISAYRHRASHRPILSLAEESVRGGCGNQREFNRGRATRVISSRWI